MPLTKSGKEVMSSMKKTYKSSKKAKGVFYAMINSGKLMKSKMEGMKKKKSQGCRKTGIKSIREYK